MRFTLRKIGSIYGLNACFTVVAVCIAVGWCPMSYSFSEDSLVVDVLFGEPVPFQAMLEDLATVDVIFLGEIHTIARHHRLETELLKRLTSMGVKLALGMEMICEEQQAAVDRWQKGRAGFRELAQELGEEKWTNLRDYESLITSARQLGVPITGLNAPENLVRKVAQKGLDALTEPEFVEVPRDVRTVNPEYDRLLRMRLRVHKAFERRPLDNIILAQCLRDATMARAVFRFLESSQRHGRSMLVVAGAGHMNYGFGIPERLAALRPTTNRIVMLSESGELVLSEFEKQHSTPVEIRHKDLRFIRSPIADYLVLKPLRKTDRDVEQDDDVTRSEGRRASQ